MKRLLATIVVPDKDADNSACGTKALGRWLARVLDDWDPAPDDASRYATMRRLGHAGETHRRAVYARELGALTTVDLAAVHALLDAVARICAITISDSRRGDGLYEAYDLLELEGESASIGHLEPMLEGQAAVPQGAARLLDQGFAGSPQGRFEVPRELLTHPLVDLLAAELGHLGGEAPVEEDDPVDPGHGVVAAQPPPVFSVGGEGPDPLHVPDGGLLLELLAKSALVEVLSRLLRPVPSLVRLPDPQVLGPPHRLHVPEPPVLDGVDVAEVPDHVHDFVVAE